MTTKSETKITAALISRRTVAGLVAGLVLAALACAPATAAARTGTGLPAAESSAAPRGQLTLANARQVFNTFAVTDEVARAAGDEPLELSLVSEAQVPLTVSAYEQADYTGTPAPNYRYGAAVLYVPQMKSFPLWFVAVAPRIPVRRGPARTAIMVFSRPAANDSWQLSLSTLLQPGAALPRIAVGPGGHATALATFDHGLIVSPNSVGALHAALADDGRGAAAASVVAAGPDTTGMHDQITAAQRHGRRLGLSYNSQLQGSAYPLYALGTSDGGGLVLYSLVRTTVIMRNAKNRQIPIPEAFAPIFYATGHLLIKSELDTGATYQYAAEVPPSQPAGQPSGLMRVIASDGGPTSAGGI
jgi:hypothetical protein